MTTQRIVDRFGSLARDRFGSLARDRFGSLALLAATALASTACREPDQGPPPHDSSFDESGDGNSDPTNAGDDGNEPEPPEAELCDAGDEAWVKRAIPFVQGRKPESIREVRVLVSAIEQLDAQGLDGRRLVIHGLAQGEVYFDRWRNYYYEQFKVHRRGDQRNGSCYDRITMAAQGPELAETIRNSAPTDATMYTDVSMQDVLLSSLQLDDITPAYRADMFARMGAPITGGNVNREEIEATNRTYYGKLFDGQYLGRTIECSTCHTTRWSITDDANENIDRHFPVYEGNHFEHAVYGEFGMDDPLDENDVHALFRHSGFVDYSWCNDQSPDCNVANAVGQTVFGMELNCGIFRADNFDDPFVDLEEFVPHMAGEFDQGNDATLFELDPRFRAGLDALANSGVSANGDGALDDPNVGLAFLFSMNQANEMWKEAMGYSLTVANRFPRNAAQRDTLAGLTEAFFNSRYSVRALIAEVALDPHFNQAPPDTCGTSTPYHMPALFDPFTKSASDPQQRGNGVGDMLHRYSSWVLIQSAMRSNWWALPQRFGPTTTYGYLPAMITSIDGVPAAPGEPGVEPPPNVNPHIQVDTGTPYGLCGSGFYPPCIDSPFNYEFLRDMGVYINAGEGGSNGVDFNGLLHWEEEVARGVDPMLQGECTGPLGMGCAGQDFAATLAAAAAGTAGATVFDLASAIKDRFITEPEIYNDAEVLTIEALMGVTLDVPLSQVPLESIDGISRRYIGVLLNTPQFMLDGVTSAPQDPAADPIIVVPGTSTAELCMNFVGLVAESAEWSAISVSCGGDGITVQ
ncbi:MAG: hypothetical protein K0V04_31520 [Deltaproteobacteria bacterium]|nr:hypothetical protein [Deltaproteobacteria bacterium]